MIDVVNRQRLAPLDRRRIAELGAAVLDSVEQSGEITGKPTLAVAFVRDREIKQLNSRYRQKNEPTDVLSFPADNGGFIGDVVISIDSALRQAGEMGHSLDREISELLIHGVLHLCGFDHEIDGGVMNRIELKLRRKLLDRR